MEVNNMTDRTIQEIRAELAEAEKAEKLELERLKEAFPPIWQFTIKPAAPRSFSSTDELYDDTCRFYELEGEVINREEAAAVGHTELFMRGGGMTYVYNTLSHRIICATGGGTIYISRPWSIRDDTSAQETMEEVNAFLLENPEGGDITEIVERHRTRVRQLEAERRARTTTPTP
jgi:hypothetical protein